MINMERINDIALHHKFVKSVNRGLYVVVKYVIKYAEHALGGAGVGGYRDKEKFISQLNDLRYLDNYNLIILSNTENEVTVWFFFNEINSKFIFGGWIAVLNFMMELKRRSISIGVLVRSKNINAEGNELLRNVLRDVDVLCVQSGSEINCGKRDVFFAYDWVTAYILLQAKRTHMPGMKLCYFCQEDEEIFYPNGSTGSLVRSVQESFLIREIVPLFNSSALRSHFAKKLENGCVNDYKYFEQAICKLDNLGEPDNNSYNDDRYVLVYGRPEAHASRNMFELAILSLHKSIVKNPRLFDGIKIIAIGSGMLDYIELPYDNRLVMKERVPYEDYLHILKNSIVVISLMNAPHPSVPPFESVRNGVRTVVNCGIYGRSESYYKAISRYFYPAKGNSEDLSNSIIAAIKDFYNYNLKGHACLDDTSCNLTHPVTWDDAFSHLFDINNQLVL